MYDFDPTTLADEIASILKEKRPASTDSVTLDITVDVGKAHKAFYEIYFLDSQKNELEYYGRPCMDSSKTFFQKAVGELDAKQVTRLLNSISVRVNQTPKQDMPRKTCVKAHWEW